MNVNPMTPLTELRILHDVPLEISYKDTLEFSSVSTQETFFKGKTKYTFTDLSPIRMQNMIRVPVVADNLYDCNYIMFKNSNFNNKWFYAFIKEINFINVNMCEISFEIDVIQTWLFDINLNESFVEREHTNDDTIGSNLVDENLELGDYISYGLDGSGHLGRKAIVVAATVDSSGADAYGGTYCGIYSGVKYNVFSSAADVNAMIEAITPENRSSAIVSIFMMPAEMVGEEGDSAKTYTVIKSKKYDSIDGYTPKNNKLFTYPYNFLYVTNLDGNGADFHYEYFNNANCRFLLAGDMSCNPQVFLAPMDYKGVDVNYNEKMVISGYPQCTYSTDSYKAWLAQNGGATAIGVLGPAFMTATGLATGNAALAVSGAVSIGTSLAKINATSNLPRQASGSPGSSASYAVGIKDFAFMQTSIRAEYARIIDNYFSMYGYKTNKVKVPNIRGRESWNYVKTIDSKITGSIPFNDLTKIRGIFDNGVTFWHGDYVGQYNRSNDIIGG